MFKLLSRSAKSGKRATQARELLIPAELEISSSIVEQEMRERQEKVRVLSALVCLVCVVCVCVLSMCGGGVGGVCGS